MKKNVERLTTIGLFVVIVVGAGVRDTAQPPDASAEPAADMKYAPLWEQSPARHFTVKDGMLLADGPLCARGELVLVGSGHPAASAPMRW